MKRNAVDLPEKLTAPVVRLIERSVSTWRFVPLVRDAEPVIAKAAMSQCIVARPLG